MIRTTNNQIESSDISILEKFNILKNGIDCIEILMKSDYTHKLKQEDKLTAQVNKLTNQNQKAQTIIKKYKEITIPKAELKIEFLNNLKTMLMSVNYLSTTKKQYFIDMINKVDDLTLDDLKIQNNKVKSILGIQK